MHDSYTRWAAWCRSGTSLGEVIFGGVGSGLYGILVFVILAVFIAGLWLEGRRNTWKKK
jgi:K+-transporting ATPase ATPase A chain